MLDISSSLKLSQFSLRRAALVVATTLACSTNLAAQETIAPAEVERGMRGYGLTVFAGTQPERFEVEVVGVLQEFEPGTDVILAQLSGQGLEEIGVAGGMSGSPVYFDGRLAGAVAFSWNFSKGALAGITPISSMRALGDLPRASPRAVTTPGSFEDLLKPPEDAEVKLRDALSRSLRTVLRSPLDDARSVLELVGSGWSSATRSFLHPVARFAPAGRATETASTGELEPGSAVAGVLMDGDLQMAVTGTVTERRGDQIVAMGHPFLGIGPVHLPMAEAEVVSIVPSVASSFKISNVGPIVGAFDQDRKAGLRGVLGAEAPMIPIRVAVTGEQTTTYDLEMADFPAMMPSLVAVAALQTIETASYAAGVHSLDLVARLRFERHDELVLRQSFDGGNPGTSAAIYLLTLAGFLSANSYGDPGLEAIDLEVELQEEPQVTEILQAVATQTRVRRGQQVRVAYDLRPYRGERRSESVELQIPHSVQEGPLYLFFGDGGSVDAARLQIEPRTPSTLEGSLELLGSFHARDELLALWVQPARGLQVEGDALPDLPPSMRSIFSRSAAFGDTKPLNLTVEGEHVMAADAPLDGLVRLDLVVEDEPEP